MTELTAERCNDKDEWDTFVSNSPQGSRYCTFDIITALGCEAEFWLVKRKGYPVAAIPVITNNSASNGLPMHAYYIGLMFHAEAWFCKANRRTENIIKITEFVMKSLSDYYEKIELCLHPEITDVRGFDWFNYHEPELGRVQISPRYTAQVLLDEDTIRSSARGSRRREAGYAVSREQLHFMLDGSVDDLIGLWQQSLKRQNNTLAPIEIDITRNFAIYILKNDLGCIAVTRDKNEVAQTAGLVLFDYNGLVHLPVVGTSQTRYGGSLLYFSIMEYAAERGYKIMDFNGANSPSRAYFKHSIGGEARLYFHLLWLRPAID